MKTLFRGKFFQGIRDTLVLGFRVQYGILTRENEGRVYPKKWTDLRDWHIVLNGIEDRIRVKLDLADCRQ